MDQLPTREFTIKYLQKLIDGESDPLEIASWAQCFHWPDAKRGSTPSIEAVEENDPVLAEFIGDLVLVDAINEKGTYIYGKEDFRNWLNEFLQNIENDR